MRIITDLATNVSKRLKLVPKAHSWKPTADYNPERKAKTIWFLCFLITIFYGGIRTDEENRAIWTWPERC